MWIFIPKATFQIPIRSGNSGQEEPPSGMSIAKLLIIITIITIYFIIIIIIIQMVSSWGSSANQKCVVIFHNTQLIEFCPTPINNN